MLPETYRRMLYEMRGELIVERARMFQATAHTTFKVADATKCILWRNPSRPKAEMTVHESLISPTDMTDLRAGFKDFSIGTATTTVITFTLGGSSSPANQLAFGDRVIADYTHDLPTVPKLLKKVALDKSAYEILWQNGLGVSDIPDHIAKFKEQADAVLESLRAGKMGIDEFDQVKLYTETRGETSQSGYSFGAVNRA
jgi:hypothetical protein